MPNVTKPLQNLSLGKCFTNKIHTKLRHNCLLHYALHNRSFRNNPFCLCVKQKMCIISFLWCKIYTRAKNNLFYQLFVLDLVNIDTYSHSYGYDNPPLHIKYHFCFRAQNYWRIFKIPVIFYVKMFLSVYILILYSNCYILGEDPVSCYNLSLILLSLVK